MFLIGVVVFAVGSGLCGISPTVGVLITSRIVQAIGGALTVPSDTVLDGLLRDVLRERPVPPGVYGYSPIRSGVGVRPPGR